MYLSGSVPKITTHVLQEMKLKGEKIAMLTAYDYSMAKILDESGIDVILVGDSASNVMAGHKTTLPITLNEMIYHASSVMRAVTRSLVVVDMPFGTYQGNSKEALQSAIRIMKESGANAVKIEGGEEIKESVDRILSAGIPILAISGLRLRVSISLEPTVCAQKTNARPTSFVRMPKYSRMPAVLESYSKRSRRN